MLEKKLHKAYAKDSVLPGMDYVYSLMYSDTSFSRYDIDSAYIFILAAISNYGKDIPKKIKKLNKSQVNLDTLQNYKMYLDSVAYCIASDQNFIASYNHYLNFYPTSRYREITIEKRNELAFEIALEENTYQGYKHFIETYPDAKQIKQAKEIYHFLLYENKTKDKRLANYYDFIKQYPESPYVNEAIKNIFEITTANNSAQSYLNFIKQFPENPYAKRAVDFLYYISDKDWTQTIYSDSLQDITKKAALELIPVYKDGHYSFIDTTGNIAISSVYKDLGDEYKCKISTNDFFIVIPEEEPVMIAKDGQHLMKFPFEEAEDMGMGLVKITSQESVGVVHKAGYKITETKYDNAELFNKCFIKVEMDEKFGLITFTGRTILEPVYDDIAWEDPFIAVTSSERVALTKFGKLAQVLQNIPVKLVFKYDEVEKVSEKYIMGYDGENESLIDSSLNEVVPLAAQTIYYLKHGFLLKANEYYQLLNEKANVEDSGRYNEAVFNQSWVGLKNENGWKLKDAKLVDIFETAVDSIKILSDYYALAYIKDSLALILNNHKTIRFLKDNRVRLLMGPTNHHTQEYIMIKTAKDKWQILDQNGKTIYSGKLDDASIPCSSYLVIEQNKKKYIYDTLGNRIASGMYDGIGNCDEGNLSILKNGKFGLINISDGIKLNAESDETVVPLSYGAYKIKYHDGYALVDKSGKNLLSYKADELYGFSDSLFLIKRGEEWSLVQSGNSQSKLSGIAGKQVISCENQKFLIFADTTGKYGIYSDSIGLLWPAAYDEITFIGTSKTPVFLTKTSEEEEELVHYYYINSTGRIFFQTSLRKEEAEEILCY